MNNFKEEIDDAINDIEYGVEKVELILDHPISVKNQVAVIKTYTKDNLELLIKMSLVEGYSLIEYNNKVKESELELELDLTKSFDSLPNLLMYYSPEFQKQFGLKLFERLSNIK
ncbi:hypothetical protein RB653_009954 [Dictyostelium firmibasis]|uniref:GSKIP domain-containing protein n=1 Tax=Dictyostelium firmibasis TaxID=79012 RepID=A0AAN7YP54_9MYCE